MAVRQAAWTDCIGWGSACAPSQLGLLTRRCLPASPSSPDPRMPLPCPSPPHPTPLQLLYFGGEIAEMRKPVPYGDDKQLPMSAASDAMQVHLQMAGVQSVSGPTFRAAENPFVSV